MRPYPENFVVVDKNLHSGELTSPLLLELRELVFQSIWESIARVNGVSAKRWQRANIFASARIFQVAHGELVFDQATWARLVSLIPGSRTVPTRVAARFGINSLHLRANSPARSRWLDFRGYRRARHKILRQRNTIVADIERSYAQLSEDIREAILGDGEHDKPFDALPAYALAARLEQLLRTDPGWHNLAVFDALFALNELPENTPDYALITMFIDEYYGLVVSLIRALANQFSAQAKISDFDDILGMQLSEVLKISREDLLGAKR